MTTTLTPLLVETLEEVAAHGDQASAEQASRLLRFHESAAIHNGQVEHARRMHRMNPSPRRRGPEPLVNL